MAENDKEQPCLIDRLPTGIPHLDSILGGGIPEFSLTLLVGAAGTGKTTLCQQLAFHNATPERPALYVSLLGEPTLKVLRYQQQFTFFQTPQVGRSVHFISLSEEVTSMRRLLQALMKLMGQFSPRLILFDSLRTAEDLLSQQGPAEIVRFVHELATLLCIWHCTGFLLGAYSADTIGAGAVSSVADNVLLLSQDVYQGAILRHLQVVKMRGQAPPVGRHAFRITSAGVQLFPRLTPVTAPVRLSKGVRASFGVAELDAMMGGGLPRGQVCMVAGSSGTGKTLLALHLAMEGVRQGEPCVMATFEESPAEHAEKMAAFGWDLDDLEHRGLVRMLYLRPIDLSLEEVMYAMNAAIDTIGAQRVILNSISGMESTMPPLAHLNLREGIYRMTAQLTARGLVVLFTSEMPGVMGPLRLSTKALSFLADNIILLRYVEIAAELRRALTILKMRTSAHDNRLREYRIVPGKGIVVEQSFQAYSGVLTGIPTLRTLLPRYPLTAGLTDQEESLMHTLLALKQATPQELAQALGSEHQDTSAMLDRLAKIGYVVRTDRGGQAVYRMTLVTPEHRPEFRS